MMSENMPRTIGIDYLDVDAEGRLVLPAELRDALGIIPGDSIRTLIMDDGTLIVGAEPALPKLTEQISQLMKEKGITVADILAGLEEIGEELFQEQYGHLIEPKE